MSENEDGSNGNKNIENDDFGDDEQR